MPITSLPQRTTSPRPGQVPPDDPPPTSGPPPDAPPPDGPPPNGPRPDDQTPGDARSWEDDAAAWEAECFDGPRQADLASDLAGLARLLDPAGRCGPLDQSSTLSELLGVDSMDDDACLDTMVWASRMVARCQAVQIRAQHRFTQLRPPTERNERAYSEFAADEIAAELNQSPASARNRLSLAHTLAGRLPATLTALDNGTIDYGRAAAMAELTDLLTDDQARQVEDDVLARGGRPSHAAFRQAARRAGLKADPAGAENRRNAARADRGVAARPREDGTGELTHTLPIELCQAIYDELTSLARLAATPGDPRTLDQRRADVLTGLLLGTHHEHMTVEVHVTVPATTLLGLADDPGDLEGYGPVPAELARELAENGTWRRIVTDPVDGTVLDVGRRRYPSAALARHVKERDRTCRFIGCNQPARRCDIDHTVRHTDGGTTHDGQLDDLCRHHHRLKDEQTGWTLTQPEPGVLEWTSPTGRIYRVDPTPADHNPPRRPGPRITQHDTDIDSPHPPTTPTGHTGADDPWNPDIDPGEPPF